MPEPWGEGEQILIAGDEPLGLAVEGDVQQHVVLGVAADLDAMLDGNHPDDATQQLEEVAPLFK